MPQPLAAKASLVWNHPRVCPGLWEQLGLEVDVAPLWWILLFIVWLLHKNHKCRFGQEQLQSSVSPSAAMAQDEVVAKEN